MLNFLKPENSKIVLASVKSASRTRMVISLTAVILAGLALASCASAPAARAVNLQVLPKEISVDQAYELYEQGTFFLDVRTQEEWDDFHAPNSTHIPLDQLEVRLNELPQDEPIVVVCRSGNRSQAGRDILLNNGFEEVTSMAGGLKGWQAAGYPVE